MRPHISSRRSAALPLAATLFLFLTVAAVFFFGYLQRVPSAQAQEPQTTATAGDALSAAFSDVRVTIDRKGNPYIGAELTFTATLNITDVAGLDFIWNFGDQTSGEGQVVQHSYRDVGRYPVRVSVRDAGNEVAKAEILVTIAPVPITHTPTPAPISIGSPNTVEAGVPIEFIAYPASTQGLEFSWDFGDGTTATGTVVTHVYEQPGTYWVRVELRNSGRQPAFKKIVVTDATIVGLDFSYTPDKPIMEQIIRLTATVERGTNVRYEWFFSDGKSDSGQSITRVFNRAGDYTVTLRATNVKGSLEIVRTITIGTTPPKAIDVIINGPARIGVGKTFIGSVLSSAAVTYHWDWGNGATNIMPLAPQPEDEQVYQHTITYTYTIPGKYPLVVTAMNESGHVDWTGVVYVEIAQPPQSLTKLNQPDIILPRQPATFSIGEEDVAKLDCDWTVVDPKIDPNPIAESGAGTVFTSTFVRSGNYVLHVTCVNLETGIQKQGDFVVRVAYPAYLPLIANNALRLAPPGRISTPTPLPPATPTPSATPTSTMTPTMTPTQTPTNTATETPTNTPTETFVPTATPTMTPTETLIPPTVTPTMTATPEPTATLEPTATPTEMPGGTIPQP